MALRITVVTENRNFRTLPFTPSEDHLTTGSQWEEWLEGIEREFRYFANQFKSKRRIYYNSEKCNTRDKNKNNCD